jgi:hypothetical protein
MRATKNNKPHQVAEWNDLRRNRMKTGDLSSTVAYTWTMETFLRYIELVLTAAGVVVVVAVFALFRNIAPWEAAAICAVAVSVIHGAIFFAVRSKQRRERHEAVVSIRSTLDELVDTKLNEVLNPAEGEERNWRFKAQRAVWEIQSRLSYIEAENIRRQKMN